MQYSVPAVRGQQNVV